MNDRQLEEALTHRTNPLHLAVFDLDESTAIRYAAARQLLERAHEADPRNFTANPKAYRNAQAPCTLGSR
jgi:hypothetical protein